MKSFNLITPLSEAVQNSLRNNLARRGGWWFFSLCPMQNILPTLALFVLADFELPHMGNKEVVWVRSSVADQDPHGSAFKKSSWR